MYAKQTIIDVTPLEHSSSRTANRHQSRPSNASPRRTASSASSSAYRAPYEYASRRAGDTSHGNPYAHTSTQTVAMQDPASIMRGFTQMALGAGLVLIGIPMLILPGPGLLAIGGGMALAAHGARKVLGV